jgi:hypothetical protein
MDIKAQSIKLNSQVTMNGYSHVRMMAASIFGTGEMVWKFSPTLAMVVKLTSYQGTLISSYIRHSSSIRSFSFFPERPDRIVCGRGDGNVTTWDLSVKGVVDNIIPDPDWYVKAQMPY